MKFNKEGGLINQQDTNITASNKPLKFPEQKTLRDEFAMAALATLRNHGSLDLDQTTADAVARIIYQIADAMLNERNKGV